MNTADPECPNCRGEGSVDSGGVTPWGTPIDVPCECLHEEKTTTLLEFVQEIGYPKHIEESIARDLIQGGYILVDGSVVRDLERPIEDGDIIEGTDGRLMYESWGRWNGQLDPSSEGGREGE